MIDNLDKIEHFSNIIITKATTENLEYLDAIISYCADNELEIYSIIELLSPSIISKLEEEAINNRMLKNTTKRLVFL